MKRQVVIQWKGRTSDSKYCPVAKILKYFTTERKNVIVRLDYSESSINFDEIDIFIPKIKISNLFFHDVRNDRYKSDSYAIFTCDYMSEMHILKIFEGLSRLGDVGHSFEAKIDDMEFNWDGDGSDRIEAINGIKDWTKILYLDSDNNKTKYRNIANINYLDMYEHIMKNLKNADKNYYEHTDEISQKASEQCTIENKKLKNEILSLKSAYTDEDEKRDKAEERKIIKQIKDKQKLNNDTMPIDEMYNSIMRNITKSIKESLDENFPISTNDKKQLTYIVEDKLEEEIYSIVDEFDKNIIRDFVVKVALLLKAGRTLIDLQLSDIEDTPANDISIRISNRRGRTFISYSNENATGVSEETPYPFNFRNSEDYDYEIESLLNMLDQAYFACTKDDEDEY